MLHKNIELNAQVSSYRSHNRTRLEQGLQLSRQHLSNESFIVNQYLAQYRNLCGSTTYFLEQHANKRLIVDVLEQAFTGRNNLKLFRRSILHFGRQHNALVYAESALYLSQLTPPQKQALMRGRTAIGKLLDPTKRGLIEKHDVDCHWIPAPTELNTRYPYALMRHYQLLYQGAVCADIREVLNHESLQRIEH